MPLTAQQKKDATLDLVRKMFVEPQMTANFNTDELSASISNVYDHLEANAVTINNLFDPNIKANATVAQKSMIVAIAAMKYGGLI